jgi:hypothetical protein
MAWIVPIPPSARHPQERYQVCFQDGKRHRSAGIFPTKRLALAEKRAIERGDRQPFPEPVDLDPQKARMPFGEYVSTKWWPAWKDQHPSSEYGTRKKVEKRILPTFGDIPIGDLDASTVGAWKAAMIAEGLAPRTVNTYLDAMDRLAASYRAIRPAVAPPRVLAALGPKMLALAAERSQGAHTYLAPPEHTATAREKLGHRRWLLPEQGVILETDPGKARTIARRHLAAYLDLPNYTNHLRRLGFTDADLAAGGSDRLVDAVFAWGDLDRVARRVQDHLGAGANHVCVQVLDADPHGLPIRQWRELASALP